MPLYLGVTRGERLRHQPCHSKAEIARTLLDQARAWGVPYRCIGADAEDGDHPNFLAELEARQEP